MDMQIPGELAGVTKRFGAVTALDGISMSIQPGELVALLGPNGAGKTTAVRLLLGLGRATSGTVRVFGADPSMAANRVRTGAMLQIGKVPETLRVREHIELFSSYYPNPLPFSRTIESAALGGLENRLFGELSGGQRQRVLFALAICGNPDLLILDEPTVGLDVESRRMLWQQIRLYLGSGRSVLLTTHYLEEADALASRVVVIDHGHVIAEGAPAEIKQRAAGKRVRCATALPLPEILGLPFVSSASRENGTTEILTANAEELVRALLARDRSVSELEVTGAGLEDAFLALTRQKEVA